MRDRKIIDAHVHIVRHLGKGLTMNGEQYSLGNGYVRYADGTEKKILADGKDSFTPEDLVAILDENGVEKAVMLQGSILGFCNEYTWEGQKKYPGRLFGMGTFDPYCVNADRIMRRQHEEMGFLGYKFEMSIGGGLSGYHPGLRLDGDEMRPVFEYSEKHGMRISLDMQLFGESCCQVKELADMAARYPGIMFVMEHCNAPRPQDRKELEEAMKLIKPLENIYVTTAAIEACMGELEYPFPKSNALLEVVAGILGHRRIMWGTDVPQTLRDYTYPMMYSHLSDTGLFSEDELDDIYCGNASRFYGI